MKYVFYLILINLPLAQAGEPTITFTCKNGILSNIKTNKTYPSPTKSGKENKCVSGTQNELLKLDEFLDKNSDIQLNYPFNTPYQYAIGINTHTEKKYPRQKLQNVDLVINTSNILGTDPLMVLSIGMMESPWDVSKVNNHLHDTPFAKSLGCMTDPATVKSLKNQIKVPDAIESENFQKYLRAYAKSKNISTETFSTKGPKSYVCLTISEERINDYGSFEIIATKEEIEKRNNKCCRELPFNVPNHKKPFSSLPTRYHENVYADAISLYHAIKLFKDLQTKSASKNCSPLNSPECKLQRFNGYSTSCGQGMADKLANFRLGVNTFKNPTYGLGAMDFYLNTFMPNPVIQQLLPAAPSVLCQQKGNGTHKMPLNYYIKRHGDALKYESLALAYASSNEPKIDFKRLKPLIEEIDKIKNPAAKKALAEFVPAFNRPLKEVYHQLLSENKPNPEVAKSIHKFLKFYFTHPDLHKARKTVRETSISDNPAYTWKEMGDQEYLSKINQVQ